jgi:hypothetical protein
MPLRAGTRTLEPGPRNFEETLRAASKPCEFGESLGASFAAVHVLTLLVFALGWPALPARALRKSTFSLQLPRSMIALSLGWFGSKPARGRATPVSRRESKLHSSLEKKKFCTAR